MQKDNKNNYVFRHDIAGHWKLIKLPTILAANAVGIKITDHDREMDNLRLS